MAKEQGRNVSYLLRSLSNESGDEEDVGLPIFFILLN